jgi:hypothetical protein
MAVLLNRRCTTSILLLALVSFSLPLVLLPPLAKAAVLYDSGDPTPAEQLVLEYVNRARTDPVAEGQRLGIDIHEGVANPSFVGPRPPLAMNKILLSIAQAHSHDMYNLNYFSHNDPNGTTPFGRMTNAGYDYAMAGENMGAGGGVDLSATELEDLMMVDAGTSGRPHRVNLLDLINPYPCGDPPCAYEEIGIGYHDSTTPNSIGLSSLITEDFGATATTGPFLLGVVYDDLNNNFYDIGEGIPEVTITTSNGNYYAVSSSVGGYAIPIGTSGTITVTASGPGFGPITKTVSINGSNVKLDFIHGTSPTTTVQTSSTSSTSPISTQLTSTQSQQTSTSSSTSSTLSTTTSTTSAQISTTTSSTSTSYSNTQASTATTQIATNSTETAAAPVASDFSIAAEPNPITMAQASTSGMTLILKSIGAFNQPVTLSAGNLPPGVHVSFSSNPVIPPPGGTTLVTVTVTATRSVSTGTYTFILAGSDPTEIRRVSVSLQVSGCLIATATYGSELAPEVRFLRDFRDFEILQTFAGSSFMVAFNDWYYSFSPTVAQFEYTHPTARSAMKLILYPLLAILRVGAAAFDLSPNNHELGATLSGLTIGALIGSIYVGLPLTALLRKLSNRSRKTLRKAQRCSLLTLAAALLAIALSEMLEFRTLMTVSASMFILAAITTAALSTRSIILTVKHLLVSKAYP